MLKNQWEQGIIKHPIVLSTSSQSKAIGRRANNWVTYEGSLSFSFTYPLRENLTLTPLLIGVLLKNYLKNKFNEQVYLKWPNDLINKNNQKIGGVLIHNLGEILIVGVGVNINPFHKEQEFDYPHGALLNSNQIFNKEIYSDLYTYLLTNFEMSNDEIVASWNKSCIHLNKSVTLTDDEVKVSGIFQGIGERGEALIQVNGNLQSYFSGNLRYGIS